MVKTKSNVDRIYYALRQMGADFEFKPDARINEGELAAQVKASRTPVREALNRLVAEGFLTFQSGRGFFCRSLSPERILDLYQARVAIECEAVRLSCQHASNEDIAALTAYLDEIEPDYSICQDSIELLAMDEEFHLRIVGLSRNDELLRMLKILNDRIRYVRMINLTALRDNRPAVIDAGAKMSAHRKILEALQNRELDGVVAAMRAHIERRREEATEAVRIAFSQLYVPTD
ncbi:MAG: GntR family transcriptional regulator [Paracoccaceae bacterium]